MRRINLLDSLIVNNLLLSRQAMINAELLNPKGRNIDLECGYPEGELAPMLYYQLFEKVGIANRVVSIFPTESWSVYPEMYEVPDEVVTPFEERWQKLNNDLGLWNMLESIDVLSGISTFGVLFMGFSDSKDPSQPAPNVGEDGRPAGSAKEGDIELLFMRAFDQSAVRIQSYETDFNNPRYGQPTEYLINVMNPIVHAADASVETSQLRQQINVHWSRCIHAADNRISSPVFGLPRMRPVIPEIYDVRKVRGGSAEMFWKGAFPGYSFETLPQLGIETEFDKDSVIEEFQKYQDGLQRIIALQGMTAKSLAPQVADPQKHLEEQYRSISTTLGIPLRVLMGTEAGHLASIQDSTTWLRRLTKRQEIYLTPKLIRPFVDRLIMVGVLPKPEQYIIGWNDLNTMSAADKADVALKKTQAMMTYVTGGCEQIMPVVEFYINILGLSITEAISIMKKIKRKKRKMFTVPDPNNPNGRLAPQGGGRNGGDQQGAQGNPGIDDSKTPTPTNTNG